MTTTYTYTREGNDILANEEGKPPFKVAHIDESGSLRMAHGMAAEHKEAVQAFLAESGDEEPEPEPARPARGVPPCPPEDPAHGDKTPEVIEWYRKHDPAGFQAKYAGRKGDYIHDPRRHIEEKEELGGGFITHGNQE